MEAGGGHMPTFDDDSAELTSNEIDSAVRNADNLMSLQPINLRKNLTYHSYPSPDKCQIILARRCNPGTKITGIEMLELRQQSVAAGSELEHDGMASCCLSLVVSTSQGAALYHLHSLECDRRNSIMSSDNHWASQVYVCATISKLKRLAGHFSHSLTCTILLLLSPCTLSGIGCLHHYHTFQAEIKYSTRFTCKSSIAKSSRHFLFALTEDGLETWTLSLSCDCQGDVPVPALLHVQVVLLHSGFILYK